MTRYEATVSADFSGYTNSVQQSIAMTNQFAAANEGLTGAVGRNATKAIMQFTKVMELQQKMMKANVSEAARYQQILGGVSAKAKSAGKDVTEIQRTTRQVARRFTGDINSAQALVTDVLEAGEQRTKNIEKQAKVITQIGAATGGSGTGIASNLRQIIQTFGNDASAENMSNLADSLVHVTGKMGASAEAVSGFSQQIAPFAKQIGLSETSVLGFSTAFSKMGESGSRSARVFSQVLSDIDKSVRDGLPVMGKYADAMGMTTKELEAMVESDPTEMVVRFTESLAKGGSESIRTMESLGLGSVLEQRAISNLASYGKLRETIKTAQEGFASGATAESAAEQMEGLNEETAKLQESLTQVVADSGAPFTSMLTDIASGAAKASDGLASFTSSSGFQTFMTVAMAGGLALKGVGSVAGGMYAASSTAGLAGMLPRDKMKQGWNFLGQNRGKIAGAGIAGMALGQMTDMPGLNSLGMGAFVASSMLGPGAMGGAKRGWRFLTDDANAISRTAPGKGWLDATKPENQAALTAGREMSSRRGFMPGGQYGYSGRERLLMNAAKKFELDDSMEWDKKDTENLKTAFTTFGKRGKLAMQGEVDDLAKAFMDTGKIDAGRVATLPGRAAAAGPQLAGQRAAGAARAAGATTANMLAGAGGLLLNPYVAAGVGATALVAGGGYMAYKEYQEGQRTEENMSTGAGLQDAQKFASAMGDTVPVFRSLASEARNVEEAFNDVAKSIESGKFSKEGGATEEQWAGLEGEGEATFEFTDVQHRSFPFGDRAGRADKEAVSELISKYGIDTSDKGKAKILEDLKKTGLDREEANSLLLEYINSVETPEQALQTGIDAYVQEGGGGNSRETLSKVISNYASANPNTPKDVAAKQILDTIMGAEGLTEQQKLDLVRDYSQDGRHLSGIVDAEKLEGVSFATQGNLQGGYGMGGATPSGGPTLEEAVSGATDTSQAWKRSTAQGVIEAQYGAKEFEDRGVIGQWLSTAAEAQQITEEGTTATGEKATEEEIAAAKKTMEDGGTAAANAFTENFIKAVSEVKPGDQIAISGMGEVAMKTVTDQFGSTGLGLEALRGEQYRHTAESTEGQVYAAAVTAAEKQQEREYRGMSDVGALSARKEDAQAAMVTAAEGYESGVNQEQAMADFAAAKEEYESVELAQEDWMRNYLKAYKTFNRQMEYAQEDYQRSVTYAEEDFATQQEQAQQQYNTQKKYMKQDFNRQMLYMEQDYQKSMTRSDREYNKQQVRMYEDHAKQMSRMAENAAKSMYDPFTRIKREQTWSGTGLVENLRQQQEMFEEQVKNLEGLRSSGVDQSTIDLLGLNDPNKAQQLDRLMQDIQGVGGEDIVRQLNELAAARKGTAGELFGAENDLGMRQQEEDYQQGLARMAEDRLTWLADAEADYKEARERAETAFDTSMKRAEEGFDTTMTNMRKAHNRALTRMSEAHTTSMERARENFDATFETIGGDYEALAEATSKALEGEIPEWSKIVESGADDMSAAFSKGLKEVPDDFADALTKSVEAKWGKNSKVGKALGDMLAAIALGVGGPEDVPGDPYAMGSGPGAAGTPGKNWSGGQSGSKSATAGKGVFTARYGQKGRWAAGYHTGTDIAVPVGTSLYSTVKGRVVQSGANREGAYGRSVVVDVDGQDVRLLYAHMSSPSAKVGQKVSPGTYLGRSGATGNVTGPHLHFEARRSPYGYYNNTNPSPWMWTGGIVTKQLMANIGENAVPEAVIPLDRRGADFMARMMETMFGTQNLRGGGRGQHMPTTINNISSDNSVNVNGPITVVTDDPQAVMRQIERAARNRAIIQPHSRSGA